MSLGMISGQRRVSDDQFARDLSILFARHRIDPGSALAFANFESRFALSEAFRSQLFTLCTAISHMYEVDLTGGQLLALIARGLNPAEAGDGELHESVRAEFQRGYDAWNRRDLSKADGWPARGPSVDPHTIPFPPPAVAFVEPPAAAVRTPAPDGAQGPPARELRPDSFQTAGVDVEHLTLDELTRLLEKIEDRIRAMKPPAPLPADDAAEREGDPSAAMEQGDRHLRIDDDAFLARHAYLRPARRGVPADRTLQATSLQTIVSEGQPVLSGPIAHPEAPELFRYPGPPPATLRGGLRTVAVGFAAAVLIVGGLAGIFLYPSFHPKYSYQAPQPDPQKTTPAAANVGSAENATANHTSGVADAFSHRSLSPVERNTQPVKPKPVAGGWAPQSR